jgi:predicted transcriptional regulator
METSVPVKDLIVRAIAQLPDDATLEDALERIFVLFKVERGLAQAEAGQTIPHEEVRAMVARWRT